MRMRNRKETLVQTTVLGALFLPMIVSFDLFSWGLLGLIISSILSNLLTKSAQTYFDYLVPNYIEYTVLGVCIAVTFLLPILVDWVSFWGWIPYLSWVLLGQVLGEYLATGPNTDLPEE